MSDKSLNYLFFVCFYGMVFVWVLCGWYIVNGPPPIFWFPFLLIFALGMLWMHMWHRKLMQGKVDFIESLLCDYKKSNQKLHSSLAAQNSMTLNAYQLLCFRTAVYPEREAYGGVLYTALGLSGEAGEYADQVKKTLRDDGGALVPVRKDKLLKELGDVMWYTALAADEIGFTLEQVAKHNITKLQDRNERGVIKGDGGLR